VGKARSIAARLAAIPQAEERVIVATGRYLGEGFDDSRLDTLFLATPIAWKRRQARGDHIYGYVDMRVPVLARMAAKRRIGYQSIGYEILGARDLFSGQMVRSSDSLRDSRATKSLEACGRNYKEAAKPDNSFSACPTPRARIL